MASVLFYYKVNVRQVISYENNLLNVVEIYYLSSELLGAIIKSESINQSINESIVIIDRSVSERP